MQRFGRSDQRWRDRWGGGFLVATVLALVGAYWLGNRLVPFLGARDPSTQMTATHDQAAIEPTGLAQVDLTGFPKPLTVYFLQAGAFSTPERAQMAADQFGQDGLATRVSQMGKLHKVFVGAYATQEAAQVARHKFLADHQGMQLIPAQVEISADPIVTASTVAQGTYEQGVAALNGYLHAAADWWDQYASGAAPAAEELAGLADQVTAAAEQLRGFSEDVAINRFMALADQVTDNSAQIQNLEQNPAAAEQFKAAMHGYLALVDDYRIWVESGN